MTLKQELEAWSKALIASEAQDYGTCLQSFHSIADSSKVHFNIAVVHSKLGELEQAIDHLERAIEMDPYLAVAFFHAGNLNFRLGKYRQAFSDFGEAYSRMRSNMSIDYRQLGLDFVLYSCEILFNRGLSAIHMGGGRDGMIDVIAASQEKQTEEHEVIGEAVRFGCEGFTCFTLPPEVLFRPSEKKLQNLKKKDYLGKAALIAISDPKDLSTEFTGVVRARREQAEATGSFNTPSEQKKGNERRPTLSDSRYDDAGSNTNEPGSGIAISSPLMSLTELEDGAGHLLATRSKQQQQLGYGSTMGSRPSIRRQFSTRSDRSKLMKINYAQLYNNSIHSFPPTPPDSDGYISLRASPVPQSNRAGTELQRETDMLDLDLLHLYDRSSSTRHDSGEETGDENIMTPKATMHSKNERVAEWASNSLENYQIADYDPRTYAIGDRRSLGKLSDLGYVENSGEPFREARSESGQRPIVGVMPQNNLKSINDLNETQASFEKLKVKLKYKGDWRAMSIDSNSKLEDFAEKVRVKFGRPYDMTMRYKDSEETFVTLVDHEDWESALDEARSLKTASASVLTPAFKGVTMLELDQMITRIDIYMSARSDARVLIRLRSRIVAFNDF